MPVVLLPSGALAPLEEPGLTALLASRGDTRGLAAAAFAHDEVDASQLTDEDAYAVARWALAAFCGSTAAADLGAVCEAFSEPPSWRLGVCEPSLAWELDRGCLSALVAARMEARCADPSPTAQDSETVHVFGIPDPWEDEDE